MRFFSNFTGFFLLLVFVSLFFFSSFHPVLLSHICFIIIISRVYFSVCFCFICHMFPPSLSLLNTTQKKKWETSQEKKIQDFTTFISVSIISYYHSFSFFHFNSSQNNARTFSSYKASQSQRTKKTDFDLQNFIPTKQCSYKHQIVIEHLNALCLFVRFVSLSLTCRIQHSSLLHRLRRRHSLPPNAVG